MTIDEQIEQLIERVPVLANYGDVNGNRNFLRNTLLEVARDQRHACAEESLKAKSLEEVHTLVVNARIESK